MPAKKKSTPKKAARKRAARPRGYKNEGEFSSSVKVGTALLEGATFRGKAVQYSVIDGMAIFEGDIVLGTVEEVEAESQRLRDLASGTQVEGVVVLAPFRWANCRVPYTIDPALPSQSRVTNAIAHWEANTNYRFVVRSTETDYVTFRPAGGCSSSVGKRGGQQFINLGSGCSTGNTIHEIGHTIGLWHEQGREDRDTFVTINWAKIVSGFEHNFNQHIADGDDVGAYDYGSIMHYPRTAFSIDGSDTITPTDPTASIGQRTALSAGDIAAANSLCSIGPKLLKEGIKDHIETRKEMLKDFRFDTRKEMVFDTRKEMAWDTRKEMAFDPPWGTLVEHVVTPGRLPVVQPGTTTPVRPGLTPIQPGGGQPFAVVTPHQAPAAGGGGAEGEAESTLAQLDAQLQMLAEQLGQAEADKQLLQAQYDETAALLEQLMQENEGSQG